MSCDGFEGRFYAGVSREWGERAAGLGEPVGVEGSIFVGFEVEEVCAADGECAGGCGELDHFLGRVGGVAGGDACGVAVFVWDHVAFLELAECGPFPGAARPVGDVLAVARCACGVVVCVRGHLCSPFPSRFSSCPPGGARRAFRVSVCLYAWRAFSWRAFSSMRVNSIKLSKHPPGLCFPVGVCASACVRCYPLRLLFGGEELRHVLCRDLVHVAGGVEVALSVVEWPVGGAFFGVCAVPGFAEVLCAVVDVAERGFDGALVCVGCAAVGGVDCFVPFVVYEAGAVAFDADGDGHLVDVADVFGEVGLLLVGEAVPRVGERGHDGEVGGAGSEERCGFGDLVDVGVHGWVSFSLVVGVFSCVGFSVARVWACVLAQSRERWR